mgnify:CR=1 FL=1
MGRLSSPFGGEFVGIKVTIGGIKDPSMIKRTYDDVDKIFKSNPEEFYVEEEKTSDGKFKAFHVSTEPI